MALNSTTKRSWSGGLLTALIFGAMSVGACAPDIPTDPEPPQKVSPIYDPVTAVVPLPNSAGLDAEGTISDLPTIAEENAEGEFARWLTQFHGWLPETPIVIPFDGELDEASLNGDTVKLYEITEQGLIPLDIADITYATNALGSAITIVPLSNLKTGTNYGALVTTGVKGSDGNTILPDPVSFTALNRGNIIDPDTNKVLLPELEGPDNRAKAESLQGLHNTLVPLIEGLAVQGTIARKDIAVAFAWKTLVDPIVILDPATATLPLPNTAALEADGTFPGAALPVLAKYTKDLAAFKEGTLEDPPIRTAQVFFDQYLDSLHGWPNIASSLPVELPMANDVDPATITDDSVQLWQIKASGAERVEGVTVTFVEGTPNKIKLALPADLDLNANYFAFATKELKNKAGLSLQPAAPQYMAMQPHPVLGEDGKSLASRISDDQAKSIAGLQAILKPAMDIIKDKTKNDHTTLAAVWSWYTWKDPFAVFDPIGGDVPFPNAFLIGADGTADIPTQGAMGLQLALLNELNTRDGFSVLGSGWISIIGELDPTTVKLQEDKAGEGSVAIASVAGIPTLLKEDAIEFTYNKTYNKLLFTPKGPLAKGTLHAGIVSDRIKGVNGLSLKPTSVFVFLASPKPLVDEAGKSLVAQLDDVTAASLEGARQTYGQLFAGAKIATGDTPESIAVAFAFTTDNTTEPVQQVRARLMAKFGETPQVATRADAEVLVGEPGATYTGAFSAGQTHDFSNIAEIQWTAEIDSYKIYDAASKAVPFAMLQKSKVPISIFIPKETASCAKPFNVVIANHGLGGWRAGAGHTFANALAKDCLATVAIDLPNHGGRAIGATELHPQTRPANSGQNFIGADLINTRGNISQATADVMALARVITDGGLEDVVTGTGNFATKNVGLVGISLGAAVGQVATAVDPTINTSVLNVPPGKLTYFLSEPSNIGAGILAPLAELGIMPGTFAFEQLLSLAQWLADIVDPQSFAPYTTSNTLDVLQYNADGTYESMTNAAGDPIKVPEAQVLVQMAKDDMTTPNVGTIELARSLGVSLEHTTFVGGHSFIADGTTDAAKCGRLQAGFWLKSGLGGAASLPMNLYAESCDLNQ